MRFFCFFLSLAAGGLIDPNDIIDYNETIKFAINEIEALSVNEIVTCMNDELENHRQQYIDLSFFEFFRDNITDPCSEIHHVWSMVELPDNSCIEGFNNISYITDNYPIFNKIFEWFGNDYILSNPHNQIGMALNVLVWLNERKLIYDDVTEWCNSNWDDNASNILYEVGMHCYTITLSNKSDDLTSARDKCNNIISTKKKIAFQSTLSLSVSWPLRFYLGFAVSYTTGLYLTLTPTDVDISRYRGFILGGLFYYNTKPVKTDISAEPRKIAFNLILDINFISFLGDHDGKDYMGPNFAVQIGGSIAVQTQGGAFGLGLNFQILVSWKPIQALAYTFGYEKGWNPGMHFDWAFLIYNFPKSIIGPYNFSSWCSNLPNTNVTRRPTAAPTSPGSPTLAPTIQPVSGKVNLFNKRNEWWSIVQGEWSNYSAQPDSINNFQNYDTNMDDIIWVGENAPWTKQWKNYSISATVMITKLSGAAGIMFGAIDINDTYFYGFKNQFVVFGYYKSDGTYTDLKKPVAQSFIRPNKAWTFSATLYENGSVQLGFNGINAGFYDVAISTGGSLGLRTQKVTGKFTSLVATFGANLELTEDECGSLDAEELNTECDELGKKENFIYLVIGIIGIIVAIISTIAWIISYYRRKNVAYSVVNQDTENQDNTI